MNEIPNGVFYPSRAFCAGTKYETPCPGDSGGAALLSGKNNDIVLGVLSFGSHGCKGASVFSQVAEHLDWVLDQTGIR